MLDDNSLGPKFEKKKKKTALNLNTRQFISTFPG